MSVYRFTHHATYPLIFTAVEQGDVVVITWPEHEGDAAGSTEYFTADCNRYLANGTWKLVPELVPVPVKTFEDVKEEAVQLFEDLVPAGSTVEIGETFGTYRPVLETRKVGKVRVELVDDGFPLALREIAKVMTWAQTAKGYKDHDWQNLPNAQEQLAAAASRHRTDQIDQHVVKGLPLLECVDPESKLVHKAHEAFGVLAQLELMLRERSQ